MNQQKQKTCIQKRIRKWLMKGFFNPLWLFIIVFSAFVLAYALYWLIIPISIFTYLGNFDYTRAKDFVDLVITTNVALIAFTGVIASMLLRNILQQEKEEQKNGYSNLAKETAPKSLDRFKRKRRRTVDFIMTILLLFTSSIFLGLNAILTESYVLTIFLCIILLFIGLIELVFMLVFSLEDIEL